MEHQVFVDKYKVGAVSAVRVLELALEQGKGVYDLDEGNLEEQLALMDLPEWAENKIRDHVEGGFRAKAPGGVVSQDEWSGVGYVFWKDTGCGCYLLQGDINGGMTTPGGDPFVWGSWHSIFTCMTDEWQQYYPEVGFDPSNPLPCEWLYSRAHMLYPPDSSVWAWGERVPYVRIDSVWQMVEGERDSFVVGPDTCWFETREYDPDLYTFRPEVYGPYPPEAPQDTLWYLSDDSLSIWVVKVEVDEELSDRILDVPVAEGDSARSPVRTVFRVLPDSASAGISFVGSPAAAGVTYWHSVSYGPESGDEVVVKAEAPITLGDLPFSDNRYTLEWEQKNDDENWLDPAHNPYTSRVTMRWEREETRQPAEARGDLKCDAAGVDLVVYLPDGSELPEAQEQAPGSGVFVLLNHGEPTGSTMGSDEQAAVVHRMVHMEVKASAETVEDIVLSRETAYFELTLDCPGEGKVKVWKKRLSLSGEMTVLLGGAGGELSKRWYVLHLQELAELAEVLLYGLWVEGAEGPSDRIRDWSLELSVHADDQSAPTKDVVQGTVLLVNVAVAGLEERDETTVGCFVPLNDDDDNHNGIMDKDEVGPVTQVTGDAESMNEDNLVRTSLMVQPLLESGKVQVALKSNRLRLWTNEHKGPGTRIELVEGEAEWNLGNPSERAEFQALQHRVWMEGYAPAAVIRDDGIILRYVAAGNGSNCVADTIAATVSRLRVYVHEFYPYTDPIPLPDDIPIAVVLEAGDSAFSNTAFTNDGQWYCLQTELGSEPTPPPHTLPRPLPDGFSQFESLDPRHPSVFTRPGLFNNWFLVVASWAAMTGAPVDGTSGRDYCFDKVMLYLGDWGNADVGIDRTSRGLGRLVASLRSDYGRFDSPRGEFATRVCFRVPYPLDPNGTPLLHWMGTYLTEPYEWGGYWYGGMTGRGGGEIWYEGYGIDCTGLVSCAAQWAGYNWGAWWRRTVEDLSQKCYAIDAAEVQPGDLLLGNTHVFTVLRVDQDDPDLIDTIDAAGNFGLENRNFVRVLEGRSLRRHYINEGFGPRRLRPPNP